MNDQIKQLAEQAGAGWDDKYHWYVGNEQMKKFAQLIVRECVKIMYDNAIERKVPPDINQTPTHYAIAVLEHFGVEE
jgi:hypothetical protein